MRHALFALIASAMPAMAEAPFLQVPLDCTLGKDCFVEDYMDTDPGPERRDHACGIKTRDGHGGTDFALPSWDALHGGVAVRAAAGGTVEAVRDGEDDIAYTPERADLIRGRECGNAVRIRHPNGYQTLYCHMRKGSIAVRSGQEVAAGDRLGLVGLSGETNYPHLHLTVLKDGRRIDPFAPEAQPGSCDPGASGQLFMPPIAYEPTGFLTTGFSDGVPDFDGVRDGSARRDRLPPDGALVLYARFHDARPRDLLALEIQSPDGSEVLVHRTVLRSPKRDQFQAVGRKAPDGGWPAGTYSGRVTLLRGNRLIAARFTSVTITR